MAQVNINYTSKTLIVDGSASASWANIATIPFTESTINKNDWTTKVFSGTNHNYGLLIKKDPIVIESNSLFIENTPVLYSFNNKLERVNGVHTNYSTKFFVYPCVDLAYVGNNIFTSDTLKQFAGIKNNLSFAYIQNLYRNLNSNTIPVYGLHNITGGLECIYVSLSDATLCAYDIDINSLGINLPSDADRGINEETLQLFDKNNILNYMDQRLLDLNVEPYYYYYDFSKLLSFESRDASKFLLRTSISSIINSWSKSSEININYKEKCIPYPFSNMVCSSSQLATNYKHYMYNIILMGVKKVEEV